MIDKYIDRAKEIYKKILEDNFTDEDLKEHKLLILKIDEELTNGRINK